MIFLDIKYEPLSDPTTPHPPSLKFVSGAPGVACMSIISIMVAFTVVIFTK